MATERKVSVRLDANVGGFVAGMRTAEAAVRGLSREIDTSNDRTAWLAQSILALGPALVPLGASATPILSGLTMQLGLAAGAAGVAALAFVGVGDALGSINDYQLEPTAENFAAMQIELQKIGPAGADFVRFLDEVGPKFATLQMAAREGMFPGVEEGIKSFLDVLPRVRNVVSGIAEAMGDLTAQAGEGLAGEGFAEFFDYLEREAKPTLIEMGQTVGNFAEGLGAMLVAFEPLTEGFSRGFLDMSRSFSDWAHQLDESASFQGFVDYVQQSIPKVKETLGALGDAFVSLLQAAAPVGDVMLPILEGLFDAMSIFLGTPLGPVFLGIAAAMSAYGRAAALVSITTGNLGRVFTGTALSATALKGTFITGIPTLRQFGLAAGYAAHSTTVLQRSMLSGSKIAADSARGAYLAKDAVSSFARSAAPAAAAAGLFAVSMSDLDDQAGLTSTTMGAMLGILAGPLGVALGAAGGFTLDLVNANDDLATAVTAANRAMESDVGLASLKARYADIKTEMAELKAGQEDLFSLDTDVNIAGNMAAFADLFSNASEDGKDALASLEIQMSNTGGAADLFGQTIGQTGDQMRIAAGDAQALAGQLAALAGWLDKREALRGYADSIKELRKSIEGGFSREMVENLDAFGRSIIQVAESMKGPAKVEFIESALKSLRTLAQDAGPKAAAEIQKLINQLEKFGGTKTKAPKLDVDPKRAKHVLDQADKWLELWGLSKPRSPKIDADNRPAKAKIDNAFDWLFDIGNERAVPKIDGDNRGVFAAVAGARAQLNSIDGDSATVYVRAQVGKIAASIGGMFSGSAGGFTGDMDPRAIAGVVHGREVVIPEPLVRRDRAMLTSRYGHLPGMDQIAGYASGGFVVGNTYASSRPIAGAQVEQGLYELSAALREGNLSLKQRIKLQQQETDAAREHVDAEKARLTALKEQQKALEESVASLYRGDLFGGSTDLSDTGLSASAQQAMGLVGVRNQLTGDIAAAKEAMGLLKELQAKGFDGPMFRSLAASGDVASLRAFADLSRQQLRGYEDLYSQRQRLSARVGDIAGRDFAPAIKAQTAVLAESRAEMREMNQRLQRMEKLAEKNPKETGKAVGSEINDAAGSAARRR